jgi:hypothetical protein
MNIDEFLRLKGADRASLIASAESIAELEADDVLLAVARWPKALERSNQISICSS